MKIVVQRVKNAKVDVDGKTVGKIEKGFLVLLGVTHNDTKEQADYLVKKLCKLRVFKDEKGKMNLSLKDVNGKVKNLAVAVPKGIREGEKIRLIGQGKPGKNGGKNGDLLIEIHIEQDKKYRLEGYDLYTDLCLTPWEAALGTRIEVKSIDDLTKVYIPQGIESGEIIRIPGKGYYNGQGGRGDLVAEVKIMIPKKLSEKEKNIYEELKKVSEFNPRSDLHK